MPSKQTKPVRLTRKQVKLKSEIDAIAAIAGSDHRMIEHYEPARRTTKLVSMKDQLVRGRVIMRYTQLDELLSCVITKAYFPTTKRPSDHKRLWRTKRFRVFAHHILDGLYLLNKLRLVHDLRPVASEARDIVEKLNSVRNALAHSFYPENRFQYRKHKKVLWLGQDIFSFTGLTVFDLQCQQAVDYFYHRAFGEKSKSLTAIK
jgi:hypothetical protein